MNITNWPFSEDYIFKNPGIPSFFISYKKTNDFYFSGHAGGTFILFLNALHQKHLVLKILLFLTFPITIFTLIIERMHYTNDIIIGLIVSYSIDQLVKAYKYNIIINYYKINNKIQTFLKKKILEKKIEKFQKKNL